VLYVSVTHIEVCDAVPVSVFGYPLPKIHTQWV